MTGTLSRPHRHQFLVGRVAGESAPAQGGNIIGDSSGLIGVLRLDEVTPGLPVQLLIENTGSVAMSLGVKHSSNNNSGVKSKGAVTFLSQPTDTAVAAQGQVVFGDRPVDGATVTLNDGTNTPTVFEFDQCTAVGTLTLSANPAEGDGIWVCCKKNDATYVTKFEFDTDSSVTSGHIAVAIGATKEDTATNFAAAVNARGAGYGAAYDANATVSGAVVTLYNNYVAILGTTSNSTTTTLTNVAFLVKVNAGTGNDWSGGATAISDGGKAAAQAAGGGNTAVAIGSTAAKTAEKLVAAINAVTTTLLITATQYSTIASLANDVAGTVGNTAITLGGTTTNITKANMVGGADADTLSLDDGIGGTPTFYFKSTPTLSNHIKIGATLDATIANAIGTINAYSFGMTASLQAPALGSLPGSSNVMALIQDNAGTAGDTTPTKTGSALSITALTGGANADAYVTTNLALAYAGANGAQVTTNPVSVVAGGRLVVHLTTAMANARKYLMLYETANPNTVQGRVSVYYEHGVMTPLSVTNV